MEYNRTASGTLEPLPKKSVDTGSGLERVISLKMGARSIFETDILLGLIHAIEKLAKRTYKADEPSSAPFRVIADHLRTLAFASADGAQPSNLDRGYVLRKILRRAVRYGKLLGFEEPFLARLLPTLTELMGPDYPELKESEKRTQEILQEEEESFLRTLKRGGNLLNQVVESSKQKGRSISGSDAFKLKDTYGLPLDEITLLAKDQGLEVDLKSFDELEAEAKERSRQARKKEGEEFDSKSFEFLEKWEAKTHFRGYEKLKVEATILLIVKNGAVASELKAGEEGAIVLDESAFYAEMGGQVGDQGHIFSQEADFEVLDCKTCHSTPLHLGRLLKGSLKKGERILAAVDAHRRSQIASSHTATHLLHLALQKVLGPHVRQGGSLVEPERLRFDFTHHKALTVDELRKIEDCVNAQVRSNIEVETYELSLEEAQNRKEIKQFFGEKYSNQVRVVDIEESKELCGGTHAHHTGSIGFFKIVSEASVASGLRRIVASTGEQALILLRQKEDQLKELSALLKVQEGQLIEKTKKLLEEKKALEELLASSKKSQAGEVVAEWRKEIEEIDGLAFLVKELDFDLESLKEMAMSLSSGEKRPLALLLISRFENRLYLLSLLNAPMVQKGLSAKEWLQPVLEGVEGKGGGKKEMAQGSSPQVESSSLAHRIAKEWILVHLKRLS